MPIWTNAPPPSAVGPGLRIVRTPTAGTVAGAITCPDLVGCATHYYQHRTLPCEGVNCPACADGIGWRWHGWVSCVLASTNEHVLFEFTAPAADFFQRHREAWQTLRGCVFHATRVNNKPNGRITIKTKMLDPSKLALPEPPNIPLALAHIWGLPPEQTQQRGTVKEHPAIKIDRQTTVQPNGNGASTNAIH